MMDRQPTEPLMDISGFGRPPPCSLAKFIFNETAAVQGSYHAAATRGI